MINIQLKFNKIHSTRGVLKTFKSGTKPLSTLQSTKANKRKIGTPEVCHLQSERKLRRSDTQFIITNVQE